MSTTILYDKLTIKRSNSDSQPVTLSNGELAFSYVSNTLFIGDTAGGVINLFSNTLYTTGLNISSAIAVVSNVANQALNIANAAYIEANLTSNISALTASVQAALANGILDCGSF